MNDVKPYLARDQVQKYTCGPVCIANALALYGIPTSQEECQGACGSNHEGTSEAQLAMGIRKMGFYPIVKEVRTKDRTKWNKLLKWIEAQTEMGRFVIAVINGNGTESHWILIMRVTKRGIHVFNPSVNYSYVVKKRNLFKAWWNVNLPEMDNDPVAIPENVYVVSMSPRTGLTRRAAALRANLLNPPDGELPTFKVKNDAPRPVVAPPTALPTRVKP